MKITIIKNGPYIVTGGIPLREMFITPKGNHYVLEERHKLPQSQEYALCRCGGSNNKPFCDGVHQNINFDGKETASKKPYANRIKDITKGSRMNLLDDGRCAFSRFCHTEQGDTWTISENDNDNENYRLAIESAGQCVAGRLTAVDKQGNILEDESSLEIIILQDPEQNSSAAIFVKGPITIVSADGMEYEVRNRVALCRCGESANKPFCDATHVSVSFKDNNLSK